MTPHGEVQHRVAQTGPLRDNPNSGQDTGCGDPTFEELAQDTPDAAERVVPPLFGAAPGGSCASPEAAKSISLPAPGWTHMLCRSSSRLAILRLHPRRCHRWAGRQGRWSSYSSARPIGARLRCGRRLEGGPLCRLPGKCGCTPPMNAMDSTSGGVDRQSPECVVR